MSSTATGRYQSRLLNFVNRQSIRFKDRVDLTIRHAKVATTWGVQIMLYPVYLLVQAARFAGHQLQQAAKQKWQPLQGAKPSQPEMPPPVDTPIQRVLSVLDTEISLNEVNLPILEEAIAQFADITLDDHKNSVRVSSDQESVSDSINPPLQNGVVTQSKNQLAKASNGMSRTRKIVSGIASLLTTQTLVLVTDDNQILDILTPQQQQKLIQRISWEIADYWHQWRLAREYRRRFMGRVQMLPEVRSRILPPVRLFWQLMAWIQNSPIAIAVNLFQESTLIKNQELEVNRNSSLISEDDSSYLLATDSAAILPPIQESLNFLDRTVADFEAHPLQPVSELTSAITHQTRGLLQRLQRVRQPIPQEAALSPQPEASPDASETHTIGIHALIQAAIDYFFGKRSGELPWNTQQRDLSPTVDVEGKHLQGNELTSSPPKKISDRKLAEDEVKDPWLTWGDLFPNPAIPTTGKPEAESAHANNLLSASASLTQVQLKQTNLQRPESTTDSKAVKDQRSNNSVSQSQRNTAKSTKVSDVITTISLDTSSGKSEWIETKATPTGYVKHPLEQLLELLDSIMLWLEKQLVKIGRWIQTLF